MTARVLDIIRCLNQNAPFNLAESWDNVGLLIGNPNQKVSSLLIGLDSTTTLVDEALQRNANTIVTHHPIIFRPLSAINTARPSGKLLKKLLQNDIAVIACHTNLDSATDGVSDILARKIGLGGLLPLLPREDNHYPGTGIGRIGTFKTPVPAPTFLDQILKALDLTSVQMAGDLPKLIKTVAVCGGSGSDMAGEALTQGADVYLSAEIKHSTAIWAIENNFCIIDGTHFATEKPAVGLLSEKLNQANNDHGWDISIKQTKTERHPFVLKNTSCEHKTVNKK